MKRVTLKDIQAMAEKARIQLWEDAKKYAAGRQDLSSLDGWAVWPEV